MNRQPRRVHVYLLHYTHDCQTAHLYIRKWLPHQSAQHHELRPTPAPHVPVALDLSRARSQNCSAACRRSRWPHQRPLVGRTRSSTSPSRMPCKQGLPRSRPRHCGRRMLGSLACCSCTSGASSSRRSRLRPPYMIGPHLSPYGSTLLALVSSDFCLPGKSVSPSASG